MHKKKNMTQQSPLTKKQTQEPKSSFKLVSIIYIKIKNDWMMTIGDLIILWYAVNKKKERSKQVYKYIKVSLTVNRLQFEIYNFDVLTNIIKMVYVPLNVEILIGSLDKFN